MQQVHVKVVYILIRRVVLGLLKHEQMIRGDKHKRKIALVHRRRTRAYGTKRGGGISKGCH